jgi:hypothetical protein
VFSNKINSHKVNNVGKGTCPKKWRRTR